MRSWVEFLREERAVVAATTAVLMPALILFLALAVEVGEWYAVDRQLQTVADASAVAAALDLAMGGTLASATTKAGYSASADGFGGAPTIACLATFAPDALGSCAPSTTTGYVKAIVSRSQPTVFANFFASSVIVGASAVASWTEPYQSCGLALGTTPPAPYVSVTGTPTITLGTNCVLASASTNANSMNLTGATSVAAQTLISAGGLTGTCSGCTASPVVDGPVIADPLSCTAPAYSAANVTFCAALALPASCSAMSISAGVVANAGNVCYSGMELGTSSFTGSIAGTTLTVTAPPAVGTLQVGLGITGANVTSGTYITVVGPVVAGNPTYTVSASQTAASDPSMGTWLQLTGTYYDSGVFDVPSGANVCPVSLPSCGAATIVVTNSGACENNITFEGTATLTAPNSGTFSGMLFIQVAPSGVSCAVPPADSIAPGATVTLAGGIYSPNANWTFNTSPSATCLSGVSPCTGATECLTVTANALVFGGTVNLQNGGCTEPTGTNLYNVATISLVE